MLFFTEKGRCFWLNVYEIPEGEKNSKGRAIQNLIQIPQDDKIRAIIDVQDLKHEEFVKAPMKRSVELSAASSAKTGRPPDSSERD